MKLGRTVLEELEVEPMAIKTLECSGTGVNRRHAGTVRPRHFVTLFDLTAAEARELLDRTVRLKRGELDDRRTSLLLGRTLGLIFEKPSLRTRVSFEAAMARLGGNASSSAARTWAWASARASSTSPG